MSLFLVSFQSVAVMLGIGLLGFWIIAKRIVPREAMKVLTPLVIDIALPCMVFSNILERFHPNDFPGWWALPLWWLGFTVFSFLLTKIFSRFLFPKFRRESGLGLLYPNAIFTPLIIIPGIFGAETPILSELFLFTILFPFFLFNTYTLFFGEKKGFSFGWKQLLNPILIATLAALALRLTGADAYVPGVLTSIARSVGSIAFPMIMILIGGNIFIDFEKRGKIYLRETVLFVLVKNVFFPGLTLLVLSLIRPPFPVAFLVFLTSAVPPVTAAPILAERLKGNVGLVNQFLVASFVFSLATIPLAVWAFSLFFPIQP